MNAVPFNYESNIVGEVVINSQNIRGSGGVYAPRLHFPCTFKFKVYGETDLIFTTLTGNMTIGGEKLCDSIPHTCNRVVRSQYGEQTDMPLLEFALNPRVIERIEQRRRKDIEIHLELKLGVLAFGPPIAFPPKPDAPLRVSNGGTIQIQYSLTIPQSIWTDNVLPGLGHGLIRLVELPAITATSSEAFKKPFAALDQAHHQLKLGNYDEAAGKCRIALEPFWEMVEETKGGKTRDVPRLRKSWEKTLGKPTYDWLQKVLIEIKRATNRSHHSTQAHFDRLGAEMLITVTTVVVGYAARELENSLPKPTEIVG
jgi:hypothetical protein